MDAAACIRYSSAHVSTLVAQQSGIQSRNYSLDKDLHASTQAQDQMQCRLLLDVVVGQGAAVLQLLASKDQALLVWGDALLVLDLGLHILDGVRRLHLQGDGLPCEGPAQRPDFRLGSTELRV